MRHFSGRYVKGNNLADEAAKWAASISTFADEALQFFKDNLRLLIKFSIIILHKLQALKKTISAFPNSDGSCPSACCTVLNRFLHQTAHLGPLKPSHLISHFMLVAY